MQRMYGNFFPNVSSVISEKCMVTPIFFLDPDTLAKIYFFHIVINHAKKTFVLIGKFLKKLEYLG